MSVKNTWGVNPEGKIQSDTDKSLQSASGGAFGLNKGFITKFEYNANAGKDDSPADAIDFTIKVGEKEFKSRVYDITGPLYKNSEQIEPDAEGYNDLFNSELKQRQAVITHVCKALGITEKQIEVAVKNGGVTDFASWANVITSLKPANFVEIPIDVFLEYQWSIKGDNNRTFLQLPKNMKGGRFLSPHIIPNGKWTENKEEGLKYIDAGGAIHPFTKSENFMESNKAIQQIEGEENIKDKQEDEGVANKQSAW